MKAQAGKFVQKFHTERKTKLSRLLDSERWKQADVPPEFQTLVSYIHENKAFPSEPFKSESDQQSNGKFANCIFIGDEKYAVVGTVLMLIQIINEYCR